MNYIRQTFIIWALALCPAIVFGQDFLVPHDQLYYDFPNGLTRQQRLEEEYLLGGSSGLYMAEYAFGGGCALSRLPGNILFYSEYKKLYSNKIFNDTTMDVAHPELLFRYKMQVPDSVMIIIDKLVDAAANTSSYLYENIGEDGAYYFFRPTHRTAYCWSPGGRCGELVDALNRCGKGVASGNLDSVLAVMPQCRQLLRGFRRDYPDMTDSYSYYTYVNFDLENDKWKEKYRRQNEYEERYRAELSTVSHRLFAETDCLLGCDKLYITVNDKDHNLLKVDEYHRNTLYLDSLHIAPSQIYDVAQHIGLFDPGYYQYDTISHSFCIIKPYEATKPSRMNEDVVEEEDCEEDNNEIRMLSWEVDAKKNLILEVDDYMNGTFYLESLTEDYHRFSEIIHKRSFSPGYYQYDTVSQSFSFLREFDSQKVAFPLLKVTDPGIYDILANSEKTLDRDSVPGEVLSLIFDNKYWMVNRTEKLSNRDPLGYFIWNGKTVYVQNVGLITMDGELIPDLEAFAQPAKKDKTIYIKEKDMDWWFSVFAKTEYLKPAFVVANGKVASCLTISAVKKLYREAVLQILMEKGLNEDEVYVSSTLMPIPSDYRRPTKTKQRMFCCQDIAGTIREPYLSPYSVQFSLVEKASLKLSIIEDGYFVIRYTDQLGNKEFFRYQIASDYSLQRLPVTGGR